MGHVSHRPEMKTNVFSRHWNNCSVNNAIVFFFFFFFFFFLLHFIVVRLKNSVKLDISPWPMGLQDWLAGVSLVPHEAFEFVENCQAHGAAEMASASLSTCCTRSFGSFLEFCMLHFLMQCFSFLLKYLCLSSL